MKKKYYSESMYPMDTMDYKGYHIRFYSNGGAIDVNIYDKDANDICNLCDFKTMKEAKNRSKSEIDDLN